MSQLLIEEATESRLNLNTKTTKIPLDNYIIGLHIIYMKASSVAFSFTFIELNNKRETKQFDLKRLNSQLYDTLLYAYYINSDVDILK